MMTPRQRADRLVAELGFGPGTGPSIRDAIEVEIEEAVAEVLASPMPGLERTMTDDFERRGNCAEHTDRDDGYTCPVCGHLYIKWLNYKERVKWESPK